MGYGGLLRLADRLSNAVFASRHRPSAAAR
jgi:hypothetical protein